MVLFVIFGVIALVAAAGVVLSKRPVYSALFLLVNFASLAVFYIMLQAQFLAAVQVIVYAGAIVVLFLFVVMLIGGGELQDVPQFGEKTPARARWTRIVGLALAAVLIVGLGYGIITGVLADGSGSEQAFGQGSVQAIGASLYTDYLFPFELTSVLLLVGMVGAVALARKAEK